MRDRIDQEREESPLRAAPEAYIIDTTSYSLEEVIEIVLNYILDGQKTCRES
jgi:cytidylate kinase